MIRVKQLISAFSAILLAGLIGLSSPVVASTPDGETPANEGVCDVLKVDGVTKGLYGLCVAYCEAQDLDTVGDKETPNNKILRNYTKKMQAGDPGMPCVRVPCPCWNDAEFANVTNNFDMTTSVCEAGTTAQIRNFAPALQFAIAEPNRPLCRYTDTTVSPRVSYRFKDDPNDPKFDPASWQSCYDDIASFCAP